ncbi:MAG: TonB-dependent receptor [Bryobacteraceae bacterium]|nr:TonB-dependent receptor [Bryobacteraceae bacterium]
MHSALRAVTLFSLASSLLFPQSQAIDGNVEGVVRAKDGLAIAGAIVKITNRGTGLVREAVTNEQGQYRIQLLPVGAYSVSAAKPGFANQLRPEVALGAGQTLTLDFSLQVGEVATTVEVTEEIPAVEVGRTSAYSNIYTAREARNLPTAGRSLLDFFVMNPAVNAPPLSTGGSGTGTPSLSFGGLGFRQINVDGVSNNIQGGARNLVISQESIGSFQLSNNYPAEFGRQAAVLMNSFSQSGTNDLHGSGFLFARNKALSARPFLLAPTAPTPEFFRYNFGGTVSGALIKNKAFFFGTYERWTQDLPVISTFGGTQQAAIGRQLGIPAESLGTFTTTFRAHTATAKLDYEVNAKNRISARYNFYFDRESPLQGGQQSREVSTRFDEAPQSFTTQLVTAASPTFLNEARFLFATRGIENGVINPLNPQINIAGIGNFNGNSDGVFSSRERGVQLIDNVTWNRGVHSFKAGFDLLPVNFRERTRNLNGTFTFAGLPAVASGRGAVTPLQHYQNTVDRVVDPATGQPFTYSQFTRALGQEFFNATVINQGYFFQDDWRINSRLKLHLGLRYELFARPSGLANPDFPATGVIPQDKNNWAPRISMAFDPLGKGKSVIRAGYGIYYNTTVAQTFNTFLRGNGREVRNVTITGTQAGAPPFTRSTVPAFTGGTLQVSNLNVFGSSFDDPMVHSYFVSFDQEIAPGHSLSVQYLGNRARSLPYALLSNLRATGTLPDGRVLYGGTANRPDPRFGNIFTTVSQGYQNFNGMLVTLTRRLSHGLSFQAGYLYQDVQGVAYVNGAGAFTNFGATVVPADPARPESDRGRGDFNQPHRFTLTAVWEPRISVLKGAASQVLNGWQLSTRTVAQSGLPFSPLTGQDNNGDTQFTDRPVGIAYNSYRLPTYATIDLRLTRNFRMGERRNLELLGEVFNLTSRLNATNVNRTWGPNPIAATAFNQPTAAETSRQFQLGVRYSF